MGNRMFVVFYLFSAFVAAILLTVLGVCEGLPADTIVLRIVTMYVATQALIIASVIVTGKGFVVRVRSARALVRGLYPYFAR